MRSKLRDWLQKNTTTKERRSDSGAGLFPTLLIGSDGNFGSSDRSSRLPELSLPSCRLTEPAENNITSEEDSRLQPHTRDEIDELPWWIRISTDVIVSSEFISTAMKFLDEIWQKDFIDCETEVEEFERIWRPRFPGSDLLVSENPVLSWYIEINSKLRFDEDLYPEPIEKRWYDENVTGDGSPHPNHGKPCPMRCPGEGPQTDIQRNLRGPKSTNKGQTTSSSLRDQRTRQGKSGRKGGTSSAGSLDSYITDLTGILADSKSPLSPPSPRPKPLELLDVAGYRVSNLSLGSKSFPPVTSSKAYGKRRAGCMGPPLFAASAPLQITDPDLEEGDEDSPSKAIAGLQPSKEIDTSPSSQMDEGTVETYKRYERELSRSCRGYKRPRFAAVGEIERRDSVYTPAIPRGTSRYAKRLPSKSTSMAAVGRPPFITLKMQKVHQKVEPWQRNPDAY
ncbi:hypothetical protein NX059_001759 [Plenodomus lindquistii]|nr:hypothetical protein NX059_001759 [Plenodomus lindquistii]